MEHRDGAPVLDTDDRLFVAAMSNCSRSHSGKPSGRVSRNPQLNRITTTHQMSSWNPNRAQDEKSSKSGHSLLHRLTADKLQHPKEVSTKQSTLIEQSEHFTGNATTRPSCLFYSSWFVEFEFLTKLPHSNRHLRLTLPAHPR